MAAFVESAFDNALLKSNLISYVQALSSVLRLTGNESGMNNPADFSHFDANHKYILELDPWKFSSALRQFYDPKNDLHRINGIPMDYQEICNLHKVCWSLNKGLDVSYDPTPDGTFGIYVDINNDDADAVAAASDIDDFSLPLVLPGSLAVRHLLGATTSILETVNNLMDEYYRLETLILSEADIQSVRVLDFHDLEPVVPDWLKPSFTQFLTRLSAFKWLFRASDFANFYCYRLQPGGVKYVNAPMAIRAIYRLRGMTGDFTNHGMRDIVFDMSGIEGLVNDTNFILRNGRTKLSYAAHSFPIHGRLEGIFDSIEVDPSYVPPESDADDEDDDPGDSESFVTRIKNYISTHINMFKTKLSTYFSGIYSNARAWIDTISFDAIKTTISDLCVKARDALYVGWRKFKTDILGPLFNIILLLILTLLGVFTLKSVMSTICELLKNCGIPVPAVMLFVDKTLSMHTPWSDSHLESVRQNLIAGVEKRKLCHLSMNAALFGCVDVDEKTLLHVLGVMQAFITEMCSSLQVGIWETLVDDWIAIMDFQATHNIVALLRPIYAEAASESRLAKIRLTNNDLIVGECEGPVSKTVSFVLAGIASLFLKRWPGSSEMKGMLDQIRLWTGCFAIAGGAVTVTEALLKLVPLSWMYWFRQKFLPNEILEDRVSVWIHKADSVLKMQAITEYLLSPSYQDAIQELCSTATEFMMCESLTPEKRVMVVNCHSQLRKLLIMITEYKQSSHTRPEPMCIHLFGKPACGKTILFTRLIREMFGFQDEQIFSRNSTPYWDGVNETHKAVVWDEAFTADREGDKSTEFLSLISTAVFKPPIAGLNESSLKQSSKGTSVCPVIVVCSSNHPYPKTDAVDPGAVWRRRHMLVSVEVEKSWAKPGNSDQLDTSRVLSANEEFSKTLPWYKFRLIDPENPGADRAYSQQLTYTQLVYHAVKLYEYRTKFTAKLSTVTGSNFISHRVVDVFKPIWVSLSGDSKKAYQMESPSPNGPKKHRSTYRHTDVSTAVVGTEVSAETMVPPDVYLSADDDVLITPTMMNGMDDEALTAAEREMSNYVGSFRQTQAEKVVIHDYLVSTWCGKSFEVPELSYKAWTGFAICLTVAFGAIYSLVSRYAVNVGPAEELIECELVDVTGRIESYPRNKNQTENKKHPNTRRGQSGFKRGAEIRGDLNANIGNSYNQIELSWTGLPSDWMWGFGTSGKRIITNAHFFLDCETGQLRKSDTGFYVFYIRFQCKTIPVRVSDLCLAIDRSNDIAIFDCSSEKLVPAFRDLSKVFITDEEFSSLGQILVFVNSTTGEPIVSRASRKSAVLEKDMISVDLPVCYVYHGAFKYGDCGRVVSIGNGPLCGKVLGIHCGSRGQVGEVMRTGVCTIITREALCSAVASLTEFPVDEPDKITGIIESPQGSNLVEFRKIPKSETVVVNDTTKIKPTVISEYLSCVSEKEPAVMQCNDPRLVVPVDPMDVAITPMFDVVCPNPDLGLLAVVGERVRMNFQSNAIWPMAKRLLTVHETINGIPGLISSVDVSTSVGFPLILHRFKKCEKKAFLVELDTGKWEMGPELEYLYSEIKAYVDSGGKTIKPDIRWIYFMKDELLSKEKIVQGKTRVVACGPFALWILLRQMCGSFMCAFMTSWRNLPYSVGCNPNSWDLDCILRRLSVWNTELFAGDGKEWDKRLHRSFIDESFRVIGAICYENIEGFELEKFNLLVKLILDAPNQYRDNLFRLNHGQRSGNFFTTTLNCIAHEMMWRYVFAEVCPHLVFDECVGLSVCGDDVLVAVRPDVLPIFNDLVYSREIAKYGQIYTHDDKVSDLDGIPRPFSDVTYLGSTPVKWRGKWLGALRIKTIQDLLHWEKRRGAFSTNVVHSLCMASAWGEKYWIDLREDVVQALKKCQLPDFDKENLLLSVLDLSRGECLQRLASSTGSDWLDDANDFNFGYYSRVVVD